MVYLENFINTTFQYREPGFFSEQCTPIENSSHLPNDINIITDQTLQDIMFSPTDIHNIILYISLDISLNINKAHGYDGISVRMVKFLGESS